MPKHRAGTWVHFAIELLPKFPNHGSSMEMQGPHGTVPRPGMDSCLC